MGYFVVWLGKVDDSMREIDLKQLACDRERKGTRRIEYKTNELDGIGKKMNIVMKRKRKLIGYLLGHNPFITVIMKRKIIGKRTRGKRRQFLFKEIWQRMSLLLTNNLRNQ